MSLLSIESPLERQPHVLNDELSGTLGDALRSRVVVWDNFCRLLLEMYSSYLQAWDVIAFAGVCLPYPERGQVFSAAWRTHSESSFAGFI
jgi:hypothetical protein